MKRVLVIGCPGSGKSTFARALHQVTGLPLYHLDMMYWNADKTTVPKDVFRARLADALGQSEWIIDGNYASTMELRMQHADTVFFLDMPTELCLEGIRARRGHARSDMPWVEEDDADEEFVSFVKQYRAESRPHVLALLERYRHVEVVTFQNRAQMDGYLQDIQAKK